MYPVLLLLQLLLRGVKLLLVRQLEWAWARGWARGWGWSRLHLEKERPRPESSAPFMASRMAARMALPTWEAAWAGISCSARGSSEMPSPMSTRPPTTVLPLALALALVLVLVLPLPLLLLARCPLPPAAAVLVPWGSKGSRTPSKVKCRRTRCRSPGALMKSRRRESAASLSRPLPLLLGAAAADAPVALSPTSFCASSYHALMVHTGVALMWKKDTGRSWACHVSGARRTSRDESGNATLTMSSGRERYCSTDSKVPGRASAISREHCSCQAGKEPTVERLVELPTG